MANIHKWSSQGFPYGLNWSSPQETLADGELYQAENVEYNYINNALKSVQGTEIKLTGSADIMTGYPYLDSTLYNIGTSLYTTTDFSSSTLLGTLTGSDNPVYASWDGKTLIASGGQLQQYDGISLTTISGSPLSTYVTDRKGRVLAYNKASDVLNYSAIGDSTGWVNNPSDPSTSQFINIGYKDGRPISAIDTLSNDIIIYKTPANGEVTGRVYRLLGEYPDWQVDELSRKVHCFSAVSVGNNAFFVGYGGFLNLAGVQEYGDINVIEAGININNYLINNMDANAKIWLVQNKKQIWIKSQNDRRVYMYHYVGRYSDGRGAFTVRTFEHQLHDVWCKGREVYIAYGNKIARLDETKDTDDGAQIVGTITGQNRVPSRRFIVIKRSFMAKNIIPGNLTFTVGKRTENIDFLASSPDVYGNTDDIVGNIQDIISDDFTQFRDMGGGGNRTVTVSIIVQKGSIELRQADYDYVEV